MEKFSDLKYTRPDMEAFTAEMKKTVQAFSGAKSYEEAKKAFFELKTAVGHIATDESIAYVRNTMDTTDKFYNDEVAFFNEALPALIPIEKAFTEALISTPFRKDFEAEYGDQMFLEAEAEIKLQDEAIIPDRIEEANLVTEYQTTVAGCKTTFRGEEVNFYGLLKAMESSDRNERREAMQAWGDLYEQTAPVLDDLYTRLIAVRVRMAEKLGFKSYTDMAYVQRGRLDYTPEDVAEFRKQIVEVVVPACAELRHMQERRIGVDKLKYYDETFMFPEGNPDPEGDMETLVGKAQEMYHELSAETGEFFDFMVKYRLFDLQTRPGKSQGGYCTAFEDYKAPFIFSNFNGTSADVDVLTHEAGHAFQAYTAMRCQEIPDYAGSTSEINEIHSMSMEHFTYPYMEKFFGKNADKYRFSHLSNSLMVIPYLVAVDEFQHEIYADPFMTPMHRREIWKKIEEKYLPWRDYDGHEFLEGGGFWMQKLHIFMYPFYYIEYSLAQMGAYEYYVHMKKDREAAWADYLRLCRAGGSTSYMKLLALGNLSSPFKAGTVKGIINEIMAELREKAPLYE